MTLYSENAPACSLQAGALNLFLFLFYFKQVIQYVRKAYYACHCGKYPEVRILKRARAQICDDKSADIERRVQYYAQPKV